MQSPVEMGQEKRCAAVSSSTTGNSVGVVSKKTPPQGDDAPLYRHVLNAQNRLIEQQATLIDRLTGLAPPKNVDRFPYLVLVSIFFVFVLVTFVTFAVLRHVLAPARPPLSATLPVPQVNTRLNGHPVYSKSDWGGAAAGGALPVLRGATLLVIISHSDTDSCFDFDQCVPLLQRIQFRSLKRGHSDIEYNFLVSDRGDIYEGRGWRHENAIRAGSISVCFLGDFNKIKPSGNATDAVKSLIDEGLRSGFVSKTYKLVGENQTSPRRFYSPGINVVNEIVNTCTDVALKKPTDITDILRQKSFKIWSLAFLMVLVVVALSLVFYLPLSLSPNPSSPIIPSSGHSDDLGDGIQIIQRHEWSARDPLNVTKISEPPKIVRIMHTAGFKCNSYQKCATQVLALQGWQVSSQGMPDVAYNYLIGGDGNVYVGRGADVQNEWMPNAIDIVYIGNYLSPYDQLTDKMEKAGRRLIARLRAEGKITQDYVVIAQNQTVNTQSPGENIFKEIIKWPHYDPSIYF
ncbi:hypothetical protein GWI33_018333 [Rhynchophorus ferrugineus]|uniref:Uncharacterized protein n=1 Tax=Rhynchophorus ferrugineus TaxID=354439 RepID=A0A834I0H1_RHYFE|nr:hypothetical protein GWI33_018333 [Rhynchophorus ferrugineus]